MFSTEPPCCVKWSPVYVNACPTYLKLGYLLAVGVFAICRITVPAAATRPATTAFVATITVTGTATILEFSLGCISHHLSSVARNNQT